MKELLLKLENFIKNDPTRVRVYLSVIFCIIILFQIKDIPIFQDQMTILGLLVIAPLIIYLFVKFLFYKKGL